MNYCYHHDCRNEASQICFCIDPPTKICKGHLLYHKLSNPNLEHAPKPINYHSSLQLLSAIKGLTSELLENIMNSAQEQIEKIKLDTQKDIAVIISIKNLTNKFSDNFSMDLHQIAEIVTESNRSHQWYFDLFLKKINESQMNNFRSLIPSSRQEVCEKAPEVVFYRNTTDPIKNSNEKVSEVNFSSNTIDPSKKLNENISIKGESWSLIIANKGMIKFDPFTTQQLVIAKRNQISSTAIFDKNNCVVGYADLLRMKYYASESDFLNEVNPKKLIRIQRS